MSPLSSDAKPAPVAPRRQLLTRLGLALLGSALGAAMLAGCGKKGPLRLPKPPPPAPSSPSDSESSGKEER